jgi:hypothetical protein
VFDFNMSLPYISGAVIMALSLLTSFVWLTQKQRQTVPCDAELPLT